ncbi:MAG: HlyD family efflux transporter periplasmic adaptor subunit [Planctomycetales bacterium]|nr:HlyD family efflux transporter periplasmic adaptor subunit [Planctomycetales bacterium]MBN8625868.1 HlyD family efflux transporter periplasmic adaptor subunit [Planctomycetota bacterium]
MRLSHCLLIALAWAFAANVGAAAEDTLRAANAVVTLIEQTQLPARSAGPLAKLTIREGDAVRAGDDIGQVDEAGAAIVLERAQAEYEIAVAEAENEFKMLAAEKAAAAAKAELQRAEESAVKYSKSISQTELDRLRLVAERSELEYRQSRHERTITKLNAVVKQKARDEAARTVELHRIRAPVNGVVVEVMRRVGEWVEPGMPVVRLVRMDSLRVEAFVGAADASRLRPGMPAKFIAATADTAAKSSDGKLVYVSPEIDPVNGQVRIRAEMENSAQLLRPGLQGTLEINVAPAAEKVSAKKPEVQ